MYYIILIHLLIISNFAFIIYSYLTIVTEIVSIVVKKYWNYLDNHFKNGEFLELFLEYTFRQVALDCYYQCLDIWCSTIERMFEHRESIEK